MNISYRTRRRLQKLGAAVLVLVLAVTLAWLCWVVWLERYVVYTREGAEVDFSLEKLSPGALASPPSQESSVEIYYNEGSNIMDTSQELTQFRGYFIDRDTLASDLDYCREKLGTLETGTAIMVDVKNIDGTFNYPSGLSDSSTYGSVDAAAVKNIKPLYAEDKTMFDTCKAWQDGEVYLEMAYNAYYTNYEISLINTWFIAKTVYPEAFADVDMTEKTNEVTKAFLGQELASEIFACPSSFGGYQKIDTATFFG